jgi:hypothetical protein
MKLPRAVNLRRRLYPPAFGEQRCRLRCTLWPSPLCSGSFSPDGDSTGERGGEPMTGPAKLEYLQGRLRYLKALLLHLDVIGPLGTAGKSDTQTN